jgi:hypothetical protein
MTELADVITLYIDFISVNMPRGRGVIVVESFTYSGYVFSIYPSKTGQLKQTASQLQDPQMKPPAEPQHMVNS